MQLPETETHEENVWFKVVIPVDLFQKMMWAKTGCALHHISSSDDRLHTQIFNTLCNTWLRGQSANS